MAESRIAWIAEDWGDDDLLMATGRFSAHVEDGADLDGELEDASLEEALAWARERADMVLIRLCDSDYFSAGPVNPDPEEYPVWTDPPEPIRRRRPKGLEMLDNTEADPPVPWDVRFHATGCSEEDLLEAVLRDERLTPAPAERGTPEDEEPEGARVIVHASTQAQAHAIACEVLDQQVRPLSGKNGDGFELYPLSPDSPVRFGGFRHGSK